MHTVHSYIMVWQQPDVLPFGDVQVYFRSDKANMQPEEIAAKQQQASDLQDELRKQIEEKKRVKVALCIACCSSLTVDVAAFTWHTNYGLFCTKGTKPELALFFCHVSGPGKMIIPFSMHYRCV